MPPLGPEIRSFDSLKDIKPGNDIILAKERAAAKLANSLLPQSVRHKRPNLLGWITAVKDPGALVDRLIPGTASAMYETSDGETVIALYSSIGRLFTRHVRVDTDTGERTVGPLVPRAIISQAARAGAHIMPIDEQGNKVNPVDLSAGDREAFVDDISETLTIIQSQNTSAQTA